MLQKILATESSPNTVFTDALRSIAQIFNPWTYIKKENRHIRELRRFFVDTFNTPHIFSFLHARTGLLHLLQAFEIGKQDEVCIQAFTCIVVPNAIIAAGAKPLYVDIDSTYNMDTTMLANMLEHNPRIKAVVVQHTFGVAADMEKIQALCKQYKKLLIEDCAHSLYSTYKGKLLGSFGDAALFSFGRDKVISSVNGGITVVKSDDVAKRMTQLSTQLQTVPTSLLLSHLLHPFIFEIGKIFFAIDSRLYTAWIEIFKKAGFLPKVLSHQEKKGIQDISYNLPNALAHRALIQLRDIHKNIMHRTRIVKIYSSLLDQKKFNTQHIPEYASSALLRYTIHYKNNTHIASILKRRSIYLGYWYDTVIAPKDANPLAVGYHAGMCPQAERYAQDIANLPTHISITEDDARYIAQNIIELVSQK